MVNKTEAEIEGWQTDPRAILVRLMNTTTRHGAECRQGADALRARAHCSGGQKEDKAQAAKATASSASKFGTLDNQLNGQRLADGLDHRIPRLGRRIVQGDSLMPCRPLYPSVADAALRVFRELILVDVIGQPTFGQVTRQWVLDFVAAIFGSYDPQARERRIKEFFLLISKKNTKSTIAAGIMMTALILNDRASAELIILAPTKEVADNGFAPARDMIKADPELAALMNVSEHTRTIRHLGTNATLKVVAAESKAAAGIKGQLHPGGRAVDLRQAQQRGVDAARGHGWPGQSAEGFVIYLTTQSDEVPVGVFKQKLDYARDVRDGKSQPGILPLIYEFPRALLDAEEHLKPENWRITNPNLGASVSESYLLNQFEQAKDAGEEVLRDFGQAPERRNWHEPAGQPLGRCRVLAAGRPAIYAG